ncbi:hypothetical protein KBT16_27110 [Nostoc sp. CCCryo 231-06]|nr:hypothetical protein [Nostoc sp. CCCryo 231-06]
MTAECDRVIMIETNADPTELLLTLHFIPNSSLLQHFLLLGGTDTWDAIRTYKR